MLMIRLKPNEEIFKLTEGKTVIINCEGCREVFFPEIEATKAQKELQVSGTAHSIIKIDHMCNPETLELYLQKYIKTIDNAATMLVFSCGVGVQTIAERLPDKLILAACDTYPLPGHQGVTPLEYDCAQCGECHLSCTGGICPITACSKSLVNGQCGGAKDGKCEIDNDMECGWSRINERLKMLGTPDMAHNPAKLRNFAVQEGISTCD